MGKKISTFIITNSRTLIPLFLMAFITVVFTKKIPYINRFAHEFTLIVLIIEWLILRHVLAISIKSSIVVAFILFLGAFVCTILGFTYYSEVIGNFIYALLLINVVSLLLEKDL